MTFCARSELIGNSRSDSLIIFIEVSILWHNHILNVEKLIVDQAIARCLSTTYIPQPLIGQGGSILLYTLLSDLCLASAF